MTDNLLTYQSAAKPLRSIEYGEGSETISQESRDSNPEAGGILLITKDEDIVHSKYNVQVRFKHFLERAFQLHGDRFDYSRFEYSSAKIKGLIGCPIHGSFYQTPDKHLALNSKGCPQCWFKIRGHSNKGKTRSKPTMSKEDFLKRAIAKYGIKYQYNLDGFTGLTKDPIEIICPIHGSFSQVPVVHLLRNNTTGCYKCGQEQTRHSNTDSYDSFLTQVSQVHSNVYRYLESNRTIYQNKKSVIDILCVSHGPFRKKAQKHLSGQGCFQCKVEDLVKANLLVGGYCPQLFQKKPEIRTKKAILYYLKIGNKELYKIGITTNLTRRLSSIKRESGKTQIKVMAKKAAGLEQCYLLEQEILTTYTENRVYRKWSTELFQIDILPEIEHYFR